MLASSAHTPPGETLAKIRSLPLFVEAVNGHLSRVYDLIEEGDPHLARAALPNIENWIDEGLVRFAQQVPASEASFSIWPLRQRVVFLRTKMNQSLRKWAMQGLEGGFKTPIIEFFTGPRFKLSRWYSEGLDLDRRMAEAGQFRLARKSVVSVIDAIQQDFVKGELSEQEAMALLDKAYKIVREIPGGGPGARLLIEGIRTAAARKKSKPPRAVIHTLFVKAAVQHVRKMFPQIESLHLVGSRLRHREARDIEFVAVVPNEADMPARNLIDILGREPDVDLFFSLPDELETHILEFGLGFDIMRWKRAAIAKGYKLNRYGLWKSGARVSNKMAQISAIVGLPLKPHLVWSLENPM